MAFKIDNTNIDNANKCELCFWRQMDNQEPNRRSTIVYQVISINKYFCEHIANVSETHGMSFGKCIIVKYNNKIKILYGLCNNMQPPFHFINRIDLTIDIITENDIDNLYKENNNKIIIDNLLIDENNKLKLEKEKLYTKIIDLEKNINIKEDIIKSKNDKINILHEDLKELLNNNYTEIKELRYLIDELCSINQDMKIENSEIINNLKKDNILKDSIIKSKDHEINILREDLEKTNNINNKIKNTLSIIKQDIIQICDLYYIQKSTNNICINKNINLKNIIIDQEEIIEQLLKRLEINNNINKKSIFDKIFS